MKEKFKKHKKLCITLCIILIAVIVAVVVIVKKNASNGDTSETDGGVQAFYLSQQDMSDSVSTSGTISSKNVTAVTTEVASPIKTLNVALGDTVSEGDVLCTFDDEAIREQITELEKSNASSQKQIDSAKQKATKALQSAQANVTAKQAALASAQQNYERISAAFGSGNVAEDSSALVEAQAAVSSAQAELDAAQSAVSDAQETLDDANSQTVGSNSELTKLYQQLNNLTVTAAQSGVITELNVSQGSIPSGTMMKIEDPDNLQVKVNIKEKDILKLSEGMSATLTCDAVGEDTYSGTVDKVIKFSSGSTDGSSSQSSGGYSATVSVEPGTPLLLGMNVKVKIMLTDAGSQIAVPYDAIGYDDDGHAYVYKGTALDDGDYEISKVVVEVGDTGEYYTAITSDELTEGDVIINYPWTTEEGAKISLTFTDGEMITDDGSSTDSSVDSYDYSM